MNRGRAAEDWIGEAWQEVGRKPLQRLDGEDSGVKVGCSWRLGQAEA